MTHKQRGFTLIELLIVVAIIGVITAIAVPNLLMSIQRAKVTRTMADLRTLSEAMTTFLLDHNEYPDDGGSFRDVSWVLTNSDLDKYYEGAVTDAWGKPFRYRTSANRDGAMVKSFGSNKVHNSTTGNFENSSSWVDAACTGLTLQDTPEIVKRGCDIVVLNGVFAEK